MQAEGVALLFCKGSALVEPGVQQQFEPMKMGPDHALICLLCLGFLTHCALLQNKMLLWTLYA
jgi:hypothetical protein